MVLSLLTSIVLTEGAGLDDLVVMPLTQIPQVAGLRLDPALWTAPQRRALTPAPMN